jgi:hypothetical protein
MAGFFDTLFGGGAEKEAADRDRAIAANYQNQSLAALGQGYQTGQTNLNQGIAAYQPLVNLGQTYSSGAPILMGALGAGGQAGSDAATAAFRTSPGYNFSMDQMMQALSRARATGGMTNSGNFAIDAMTNAQGLADQEYQNWIKNLQSTGQMGLQATGAGAQGQAAGYGGLANLAQQYATNQTGVLGNVAQTNVGASNLQASGEAAGAKNLLGAGLSLASLALGGGGFGGTGILGGLAGSSAVGNMPATGAGSPSPMVSNAYALSQGINPWG